MIQFSHASREGRAGLKSRHARGMVVESRVVDGKCVETVLHGTVLHEFVTYVYKPQNLT